jgi:hypothetical protein
MNGTRCLKVGVLILTMLMAVLLATSHVAAQDTASAPSHRHMITTNPFLVLFSWWNIEYEFTLTNHSTIGFAGSYVQYEEDDESEKTKYMGGYVIYRYHPSAKAPAGFYFGGRLGMTSVETEYADPSSDDSGTAYGFGLDIGYTWLLGENRNFVISVGAGATRLFGNDLEDDTAFLPIIRLANIGVAF